MMQFQSSHQSNLSNQGLGHFQLRKIILAAVIQPVLIRVNAIFATLGTTDVFTRRHNCGSTGKLKPNHSLSILRILCQNG
ncbi:hypothetical protein H4Q32_008457 [Labeo rohita]|uniref:Uncharacterized protein n=1 Tax=Labeo rohita TaxID=84645 RepID=A0ABQ8MF48_LABRO|nr:hypothetical protein H4Q32_008457 [Labeo rohita]